MAEMTRPNASAAAGNWISKIPITRCQYGHQLNETRQIDQ
jgi:hypothetical protein